MVSAANVADSLIDRSIEQPVYCQKFNSKLLLFQRLTRVTETKKRCP